MEQGKETIHSTRRAFKRKKKSQHRTAKKVVLIKMVRMQSGRFEKKLMADNFCSVTCVLGTCRALTPWFIKRATAC